MKKYLEAIRKKLIQAKVEALLSGKLAERAEERVRQSKRKKK